MKDKIKHLLKKTPFIGKTLITLKNSRKQFTNSEDYWESRYIAGGTSGCGSYGQLATYKADFLNNFITNNKISGVIEFGCGDGNQLTLSNYPDYLGLDVSKAAITKCKELFKEDATKQFHVIGDYNPINFNHNSEETLVLSLDVIYHLVEDAVYEKYMNSIFLTKSKYIIIYSSNINEDATFHVKHRKFSDWISLNAKDYKLTQTEKTNTRITVRMKKVPWQTFIFMNPVIFKIST